MNLNDLFAAELDAEGITYEREYKPIAGRRFAYDFYISRKHFDDAELLIELQGGVWMAKGAHNTGKAITRDCYKLNLAVLQGYHVMHFTTDMVEDGTALQMVKEWMEK